MNGSYIRARHGAERLMRGTPQFLDLKQLADLEDSFRLHCRATIRAYRAWKQGFQSISDPVERHYRDLEGSLLRRQAEDAVQLYTIIRKDMRRSFRKYMAASLKTKF